MDHAEAREALELAAVEPRGLDRLMAGDTPEAALVATHLAGCGACRVELERLRQATPLLRETVRSLPAPELRERTLAYVRALGRDRVAEAAAAGAAGATMAATAGSAIAPGAPPLAVLPTSSAPVPAGAGSLRSLGRVPRPVAWLASLAAVALLAVGLTLALAGGGGALQREQVATAGLADLSRATARLLASPDVRSVKLVDASSAPRGLLLVSASSGWIVMQSDSLAPAPAGQRYRCWVESGGSRRTIGSMEFGGGVAYWAGWVDGLADLKAGDRFGVTLVEASASGSTATPALTGVF